MKKVNVQGGKTTKSVEEKKKIAKNNNVVLLMKIMKCICVYIHFPFYIQIVFVEKKKHLFGRIHVVSGFIGTG